MMRLIFQLYILLLLSACGQNTVEPRYNDYFLKYYGGDGNQEGVDLKVLDDGYMILGNSTLPNGSKNFILVKTDGLGNQLWMKEYGGPKNEEAVAIEEDKGGNYVIAVNVLLSDTDSDVMLYKVAPNGDKLDSAIYGAPGHIDRAADLTITSEGDYIAIGYTTNVDLNKPGYSATTDLEDIYSVRTTSDLVEFSSSSWRSIYGFPGVDRGVGIKQKPDGSFLFFGTTDKPPTSNSQQDGLNMFLFPAAQDGIALSTIELQLFGTLYDERAAEIIETEEGGYVMLGTSFNSPASQLFMGRVRSNNDFVSAGSVNIESNITASSIDESIDQGFIILGQVFENSNPGIGLTRIAPNGAVLWQRLFGGVDDDKPAVVKQLPSGQIVFTGTITLDSQKKICLVKSTSDGELSP